MSADIDSVMAHILGRLQLFSKLTPEDDRAKATIFARDNELRQLTAALELPFAADALPPPVPPPESMAVAPAAPDAAPPDPPSNRHTFFMRRLAEMGLYDADSDYGGKIGYCVEQLSDAFAKQRHSGQSAGMVMRLFFQLMAEYDGSHKDGPAPWTKAGVVFALFGSGGCLGRSDPDEPVFVLCARDTLAAPVVRVWADQLEERAAMNGFENGGLTAARQEKISDARRVAAEMDKWPVKRLPGDVKRT